MTAGQDDNNHIGLGRRRRQQVFDRTVQSGSERQPRTQGVWNSARGFEDADVPQRDTSQGSNLRLPERGRAVELSKGAQAQRKWLRLKIPGVRRVHRRDVR